MSSYIRVVEPCPGGMAGAPGVMVLLDGGLVLKLGVGSRLDMGPGRPTHPAVFMSPSIPLSGDSVLLPGSTLRAAEGGGSGLISTELQEEKVILEARLTQLCGGAVMSLMEQQDKLEEYHREMERLVLDTVRLQKELDHIRARALHLKAR